MTRWHPRADFDRGKLPIPEDTEAKAVTWWDAVGRCFSTSSICLYHLGILLKCRLWLDTSGVHPETLSVYWRCPRCWPTDKLWGARLKRTLIILHWSSLATVWQDWSVWITPHENKSCHRNPNFSWWPNDLRSNGEQREDVDNLFTWCPQLTEAL